MEMNTPASGAERFLRTGRFDRAAAAGLASECDRLVRDATLHSNRRALRLGRQFVERARPEGGTLLLTALRACGWACLVAGLYEESCRHYLEARGLTGEDRVTRARIDRILIDVYMYLDRATVSRQCASRALSTFRRLGLHADVAKTQVNFANVLHRQDRHEEAGRLYRAAARYFDLAGPAEAAALCYYNLANTRVQLFDFDLARTLYSRGRETFTALGDRLHATGCLYGLAWLHMLQGDFHQALRELSECEAVYREGGQRRELLLCLLDRAETYLSLGLSADARRTAREAVRVAGRLHLSYELAKSQLFLGRALADLGHRAEADTLLKKAESAFAALQNHGFRAAALFSRAHSGTVPEQTRLLQAARKQFALAQLPLWEAACDLFRMDLSPREHGTRQRLARNRAVNSVPHLSAGYQTRLGDLAARRGRLKEAKLHWERAAGTLDAVRSQLPPAQRGAFLRRSAEPFGRLVKACLPNDAALASAWAERRVHGGPWQAPAHLSARHPERRHIEESLESLARQVAATAALTQSGRRGSTTGPAPRHARALQHRLRRSLAELESPATMPASPEELCELFRRESQNLPIVQFEPLGADLLAFVHHRGECRVHTFVDGLSVLALQIGRWRFLVETSAYTRGRSESEFVRDEEQALSRLGRWLLDPLELPRTERLLILPEGSLLSVPWQAVVLNGSPRLESTDITLSPSLRHFTAASVHRGSGAGLRLHVGARSGLSHVEAEVAAVTADFPLAEVHVFDPSRRADWMTGEPASVWHYTGHATLRADNPFYSALELADGPLFAADLHLHPGRPRLVTLAACRTGPHSRLPGDEATGFVQALLEMGAGSVVASHWAVADVSTASWMAEFYRQFLGGATVSRSVRMAALAVREHHPRVYHWGAFAVYGSGQ